MSWGWRLALGAILLTASGAMAAEPRPDLRVVTLNLFHGGAASGLIGDGGQLEARLAMVTAELRELRPDVVALQEASESWGRGNVAARLAAALGLHHVHAPATSRVFPLALLSRALVFVMNFNEGPAVLSRFPITSSVVHDLPRCEQRLHPRVMLEAEVASPWGPLRVYSTHTERDVCQHERVAQLIVARRGPLPSILMGDFNATDTFPSIAALVNGTGFIDAFRTANTEAPGLTVWQRIDADAPTVLRRVDYVFVLPGATRTGRVTASHVIVNTPDRIDDRTLWPSDHYGVLVDLVLEGSEAIGRGAIAAP